MLKDRIKILFLASVFFPFVSLINIGSDMQPYSLLLSVFMIAFIKIHKIHKSFLYIILLVVSAICTILISGVNITVFRSLFNYISLLFVVYALYFMYKSDKNLVHEWTVNTLYIWILVALIQNYIDKDAFSFLLSRMNTTENRGVTSLAPEPTTFGLVLIFYLLIIFISDIRNKSKYYFAIIISVIFLAKSSMAVLVLFLLAIVYALLTFRSIYIIYTATFFAVVSLGLNHFELLGSYRLGFILRSLIENPDIVLADASVQDRLFHALLPYKGMVDNYFLPNGFFEWRDYSSSQLSVTNSYFESSNITTGDRIMSGFGGLFFELGLFGFLFIAYLVNLIFSIHVFTLKKQIIIFFSLCLILTTAIPIGFHFVALILGYLTFLKSNA